MAQDNMTGDQSLTKPQPIVYSKEPSAYKTSNSDLVILSLIMVLGIILYTLFYVESKKLLTSDLNHIMRLNQRKVKPKRPKSKSLDSESSYELPSSVSSCSSLTEEEEKDHQSEEEKQI